MNTRYINTDHLHGLKRASPCCFCDVEHPHEPGPNITLKRFVKLVCVECGKDVKEHLLINDREEVVWPPPQSWVDRQPPAKRRKRCRRKIPLEQEPEPYSVRFP